MSEIERERIEALFERERELFAAEHPRSKQLHERAAASLLSGVPMNWMTRWPGDFPIFVTEAQGSEVVDADGGVYADLCLGDTGAMTGHSPAPTVEAVSRQAAARHHGDAADRRLDPRRRGDAATLRSARLAVHALGHRRQPVRDSPRASDHRPAQGARSQPLLSRQRRRDGGDAASTARSQSATATSARRSTRPRRPASSRSTTSRHSSESSPTATSPACWSSRR